MLTFTKSCMTIANITVNVFIVAQVGYPLFGMLGTRGISYFFFFQILEYLHVHNKIFLVWDSSMDRKLIYVSHVHLA